MISTFLVATVDFLFYKNKTIDVVLKYRFVFFFFHLNNIFYYSVILLNHMSLSTIQPGICFWKSVENEKKKEEKHENKKHFQNWSA